MIRSTKRNEYGGLYLLEYDYIYSELQVKTRWRKINFQEIAGIKGHRIFE